MTHQAGVPVVTAVTVVAPYTLDVSFEDGKQRRIDLEPLLFGPGSIHRAHTADEFVSLAELSAAVDHYVTIATQLLARPSLQRGALDGSH